MKKNERKRDSSSESSSSDSESSSSSEVLVEKDASSKSQRFQLICKSESHKWELPDKMEDYVNN